MTESAPDIAGPGDRNRLGRQAVARMRLPGPPLDRPLPSRVGSLASGVQRFASSLSRPVEIRRALAGPGSHEGNVRPPRWWAGDPAADESASTGSLAVPAARRWQPEARTVSTGDLPGRQLPRAARSVPNESSYTPGGIVDGLRGEVARVRRLDDVTAAGQMVTSADRAKLSAATTVRRRAAALAASAPVAPASRPVSAPAPTPTAAAPSAPGAPSGQTAAPVRGPAPSVPSAQSSQPSQGARSSRSGTPGTAASGGRGHASASVASSGGEDGGRAEPEPAGSLPSVEAAGSASSTPAGAAVTSAPGSLGSSASSSPSSSSPSAATSSTSSVGDVAGVGAPVPAASSAAPASPVLRRAAFQLRPAASRLAGGLARSAPLGTTSAGSAIRRMVGDGEAVKPAAAQAVAGAATPSRRDAWAATSAVVRRHARSGAAPLSGAVGAAPVSRLASRSSAGATSAAVSATPATSPGSAPAAVGAAPVSASTSPTLRRVAAAASPAGSGPASAPTADQAAHSDAAAATPRLASVERSVTGLPRMVSPGESVRAAGAALAASAGSAGGLGPAPSGPSRRDAWAVTSAVVRRRAQSESSAAPSIHSAATVGSTAPSTVGAPVRRLASVGASGGSAPVGGGGVETPSAGPDAAPAIGLGPRLQRMATGLMPGLGAAMPDLIASTRAPARGAAASVGSLASGFGDPSEIRASTGDLAGRLGASTQAPRLDQTVRRSVDRAASGVGGVGGRSAAALPGGSLPLITPALRRSTIVSELQGRSSAAAPGVSGAPSAHSAPAAVHGAAAGAAPFATPGAHSAAVPGGFTNAAPGSAPRSVGFGAAAGLSSTGPAARQALRAQDLRRSTSTQAGSAVPSAASATGTGLPVGSGPAAVRRTPVGSGAAPVPRAPGTLGPLGGQSDPSGLGAQPGHFGEPGQLGFGDLGSMVVPPATLRRSVAPPVPAVGRSSAAPGPRRTPATAPAPSLLERTAAYFAPAPSAAAGAAGASAGDAGSHAPTIQRWVAGSTPSGGSRRGPQAGASRSAAPAPTPESSGTDRERTAADREALIREVVEQVERRVMEDLERRGRRDGRNGF
jgi:hypothetical protein